MKLKTHLNNTEAEQVKKAAQSIIARMDFLNQCKEIGLASEDIQTVIIRDTSQIADIITDEILREE